MRELTRVCRRADARRKCFFAKTECAPQKRPQDCPEQLTKHACNSGPMNGPRRVRTHVYNLTVMTEQGRFRAFIGIDRCRHRHGRCALSQGCSQRRLQAARCLCSPAARWRTSAARAHRQILPCGLRRKRHPVRWNTARGRLTPLPVPPGCSGGWSSLRGWLRRPCPCARRPFRERGSPW